MYDLINGTQVPHMPSASEFDASAARMAWPVPSSKLPLPPVTTTPPKTNAATTMDNDAEDANAAAFRTACKTLLTQLSRQHVNKMCATAAEANKASASAPFKCRMIQSILTFKDAPARDARDAAAVADHAASAKVEVKTSVAALFPQTVETAPCTDGSYLFCRAQLFVGDDANTPSAETLSILQTYGGITSRL